MLFVGSDVAKALGYARPSDAISAHCRYTVKRSIPHPQNNSISQEVTMITEGDMYRLITHSKLPEAQKFESWVFDEVLPSIRKTGTYGIPQNYAEALQLAADQAKQLLEQKPKVEFFDAVAESKDAIEIASVAKVLNVPGVGRNKLFEFLRNHKVLMRNNQPYQKYVDCGYFRIIEQKYERSNGDTCINIKTLVYQKGVKYIQELLKNAHM